MEMEKEVKAKDYSIQQIVNFIGAYLEKHKVKNIVSASKAIGEVEIGGIMYQIQVVLEPDESKWIKELGVIRNYKKSESWIKNLLNRFTSITDAGIQK